MYSNRIRTTILFLLLLTSTVVFAKVGITPRMQAALDASDPDSVLRVNAFLWDQLQLDDLLPLIANKPRREWRTITVPIMIEHSARTQERIRKALHQMSLTGDVKNVQYLWLGNGITFEAKVRALRGFFEQFSELRSLDLDPEIPWTHCVDTDTTVVPQSIDEVDLAGWNLVDLQCRQMWEHGYTGQGIIVANIDTGFERSHWALSGHIWYNQDEIAGNGRDDDQNGYIDDTWGWNFDQNNNNPVAGSSHGTCTSGLIVGSTSTDTLGVAFGARMMCLRNYNGGFSAYWFAQQYAVQNGADVISSSLSYKYPDDPDYVVFRQNTDMELAAGIIHANSIGNQGSDLSNYPIPYNIATPGHCPPPWLWDSQTLRGGVSSVLGCGAYQQGLNVPWYSGRGPAAWDSIPDRPLRVFPARYRDYPYRGGTMQALIKPDVLLPTDVLTSTLSNGYTANFNGTSAATPHLGGALALLLSAEPDATPAELCEAIKMTCDSSGSSHQLNIFGAGRLKIWDALNYLETLISHGHLQGTVTDTLTQTPIRNASVSIYTPFSRSTTTDQNGHFLFPSVRTGTCSLQVSASGYLNRRLRNLTVDSAETTQVNVYLQRPRISLSTDTVRLTATQGDTGLSQLSIYNTGFDTLRWSIALQPPENSDTTWQTHQTIPVSRASGDNTLIGVEWAWDKFWVTGDHNLGALKYFYRFDRNGVLIDSLRQPNTSGTSFNDLAFDGSLLWGSNSQFMYGFDSNGVIRDTIETPLMPARAIAYDPIDDWFFVADNGSPINVISRTGENIAEIPQTGHIYAMSWNSSDADGMPLYILYQDNATLVKMNVGTGVTRTLHSFQTSTNQTGSGLAFIDQWSYSNQELAILLQSSLEDTLRLVNLGYINRWLTLTPVYGQVANGDSSRVALRYSAIGAPVGVYDVRLMTSNNTPQTPVSTLVRFQVNSVNVQEPPTAPLPQGFSVSELYPNPFNPTTSFAVALPIRSKLHISIYDRLGREIGILANQQYSAGTHRFELDGTKLSSGVYFVQIRSVNGVAVKKGVLLK